MAAELRPVDWKDGKVVLIDQTKLPDELAYIEYADYQGIAEAIRRMQVRGAPAIGVAVALGIALAAQSIPENNFWEQIAKVANDFRATRPTAVNLFWAIERMLRAANENASLPIDQIRRRLVDEAITILEEDIEVNRRIGKNGSELIQDGDTVLTHCNAGALATAGYGTAIGVIRAAVESGKKVKVIADETRPRFQGMRLTAWELQQLGIPVTVITDNMAGYAMQKGLVNCVIVGADRIAANGDVANKIGTYSLAILARKHNIAFYVAAPMSTVDLSLPNGEMIPIEERPSEEVTHISGIRIAPEGVRVMNPAFDVTPAEYVTAIITERGILKPPYEESLAIGRR
ncbi:MAG: S-methyl-5-thioribose-1-phosphate isomerase [Armatimonadetes bacterium]|nr:S-methyl-5-thioribose-1-phosphate isomerase [Armatimonadota bacterium]